MRVTEALIRLTKDPDQLQLFRKLWPDGFRLTPMAAQEAAYAGLDMDWVIQALEWKFTGVLVWLHVNGTPRIRRHYFRGCLHNPHGPAVIWYYDSGQTEREMFFVHDCLQPLAEGEPVERRYTPRGDILREYYSRQAHAEDHAGAPVQRSWLRRIWRLHPRTTPK